MSGFSVACDSPQRSLSSQQQDDFAEDKKCRICGFADTKNINIFSNSSCKQLVTKILTVYPIVLYKDDPLPKNICRKCVSNVSIMYNDILRVMKMQIKWINNVRTVQPHHNYIRVLDLIQSANKTTRESIKAAVAEDVNDLNVSRFLFTNTVESSSATSKGEKIKNVCNESQTPTKHSTISLTMDYDDGVARKSSTRLAASPNVKKSLATSTGSTEVKDIKSLLEQNGCSLLHVSNQNTTTNNKTPASSTNLKTNPFPSPVNIKEEKSDEESSNDDKILLSILTKPSKDPSTSAAAAAAPPGPPPPLTVKCRLCPLQFNSLASLASHQINHMRLCMPKLFQKKYLHKKVRRGRLISVQDRKCIRCLNCWRIFVDNKSILEHWGEGECDFYCHICGKEYAQAPKMLREHVPAAHGISYRSSKMHCTRLSTKIRMSMSQTPAEDNPDYKLYQAVSEQEPLPFEEVGGRTELPKVRAGQKKRQTKNKSGQPSTSHKKKTSPKKPTEVARNEDGSVACQLCQKMFQNLKARNSHMRKHKPVYAYGDVVLPPLKGVNPYVKDGEEEDKGSVAEGVNDALKDGTITSKPQNLNAPQDTSDQNTPTTPSTPLPSSVIPSTSTTSFTATTSTVAPSTVRASTATTSVATPSTATPPTVAPSTILSTATPSTVTPPPTTTFLTVTPFAAPSSVFPLSAVPPSTVPTSIIPSSVGTSIASPSIATPSTATSSITTTSTSNFTPLRGVRTKFVKPRSELSNSGGGISSVLKVKPLNELQKPLPPSGPLATSAVSSSNAWPSAPPVVSIPRNIAIATQGIKSEPMDLDFPAEQKTFTCIPCSDQFPSKLELFRHKRKCRANYVFTCEFCSQLFRCSADYQLHVTQNHRIPSSNPHIN